MPDLYCVQVTGSREWAEPRITRAALLHAQGDRPAAAMLLRHGQCDPRRMVNGRMVRIPWQTALKMPPEKQMQLASADWLFARTAEQLGWAVEGIPANWEAPCLPSCKRGHRRWQGSRSYCPEAGHYRNSFMVGLGSDIGIAALCAGLPNRGTMDCALKMFLAGIPFRFWCNRCGLEALPRPWPCPQHSLRQVRTRWATSTEGVLRT